jgi:hypothetical protein
LCGESADTIGDSWSIHGEMRIESLQEVNEVDLIDEQEEPDEGI